MEVSRVVKLQGKALRLSNTWRQTEVLCSPMSSGTQVCATHDHVVIAGGVETTMSQMCSKMTCTRKHDQVANFNHNDPDAMVTCGEFGLTQRTADDFYETRVKRYMESGLLARLLRM
jgi:glutamine amidotransferase PdxT